MNIDNNFPITVKLVIKIIYVLRRFWEGSFSNSCGQTNSAILLDFDIKNKYQKI
jgi:hypothetical protein